jgi:hypothetical protein
MRQFISGCLIGGVLMAGVSALAEKDSLGRSPQQQKFDYFRERQLQLDIGHMRQQLDRQETDGSMARSSAETCFSRDKSKVTRRSAVKFDRFAPSCSERLPTDRQHAGH